MGTQKVIEMATLSLLYIKLWSIHPTGLQKTNKKKKTKTKTKTKKQTDKQNKTILCHDNKNNTTAFFFTKATTLKYCKSIYHCFYVIRKMRRNKQIKHSCTLHECIIST